MFKNLPKFVFFTGKGGVGKTSLACATSLSLAGNGKKVLLVSTDPASNVGQVFETVIGNKITKIAQAPGLDAIEINPEEAAADYRERIVGPMRNILPEEALRRTLEVNVLGAFLFSRVIARRMMEAGAEGSILHLASVSSMVANEGYAAYSPSKAALSQMVRVLAREWAPEGVRVNAIGPSLAQTDMTRAALADPAHQAETLKLIPMGRFCEGGDLIGPAVMLLSDAGRYITGQTLYVDGGRTLT